LQQNLPEAEIVSGVEERSRDSANDRNDKQTDFDNHKTDKK
jgi:hypothetical protein